MLILYYNIFNRLYNQEAVDPSADLSISGNFMLNCYLRSDLLEKNRVPQRNFVMILPDASLYPVNNAQVLVLRNASGSLLADRRSSISPMMKNVTPRLVGEFNGMKHLIINTVFQDSKITLICDRDLMAIDIPNAADLERWETIISTLLVCDWNIRAWTLLEAVKGKRQLYILTKSNHAVHFLDGVSLLVRAGPLDLVVSLSAVDHLLPSPTSNTQSITSFEEVGHVLSHRHASREGDDIAIWSLLSTGRYLAEMPELLRHVQVIKTGFLISSSPRCTAEGFGWAPQTPRLRTIKGTVYPIQPDYYESHYPVNIYHSYDGKDSMEGTVTTIGFKACWLVLMLQSKSDLQALASWNDVFGHEMWEHVITLFEDYKSVALLGALEEGGQKRWKGSDQQGQENGSKIVVCASNFADRWQWKGVFSAPLGTEIDEADGDDKGISGTRYIWRVMELILV
ncbi:MAG: hypothetical protein LQ349_002831 [Xanthoria aureola]|nr:MAG: hypothetical protein LQ349_002831 [Xanthoria aureola]